MITFINNTKKKLSLVLLFLLFTFTIYQPSSAQAVYVNYCEQLSIPRLSLDRCAVYGGQTRLDQGLVVIWYKADNVTWLAGHRSTKGSTFSSLTNLRLGDVVVYESSLFIITEFRIVNRHNPSEIWDITSSPLPTLILQTSKSNSHSYIWKADKLTFNWA